MRGENLAQVDSGPKGWLEAGSSDCGCVEVRLEVPAYSCLGKGGKWTDGPTPLFVPPQVEAMIHVFLELFPDVRSTCCNLKCDASGYSYDHQGEHCRDQRVFNHVLRLVTVVEGRKVPFEPPPQLEHSASSRQDRGTLVNHI